MSAFCLMSAQAELQHFLPTSNAYMSIFDYKYWFEGDTVIDNKEYIKVYSQYCYSETDCGNKYYYAAVRQDTINEKIYCIQVDDGVERLIADFDVEAGDEVTVYSFWPWVTERLVKITDVDEVMIDDQYRKRVSIRNEYSYPYPDDFWVEGFGSITYGLFFPSPEAVADVGDVPLLLCLHINEILIYQRSFYNTCYVQDNGVGLFNKSSTFTIYPTFADDYIWITTDYESCSYDIYNIQGIKVKSSVLQESYINVTNLVSGLYHIVFYNNEKKINSQKFIKR